MELRNIEMAKELIPQFEASRHARTMLAEDTSEVIVRDGGRHELCLSKSLRMNILHVVNCEYERVRKEVAEL